MVESFLISLMAWAAALSLALSTQDISYPSVSICSRRSMALRTSSRMASSRSSALFLGFSLEGLSLFALGWAGVAGGVSVFTGWGVGTGTLASCAMIWVMLGLIWLILASISMSFSLKLFKRSSFADSSS